MVEQRLLIAHFCQTEVVPVTVYLLHIDLVSDEVGGGVAALPRVQAEVKYSTGQTGYLAHIHIHPKGKLVSVGTTVALPTGKTIGQFANVGCSEVEAGLAQFGAETTPVTGHGRLIHPMIEGLPQRDRGRCLTRLGHCADSRGLGLRVHWLPE